MASDRYQKRIVPLSEIAGSVSIDAEMISRVYLSVSPCRSGTTVLLRVFGAAGIQAHYQQIKNVLRWHMLDQEWSWQVPLDQKEMFFKETLGPYTDQEARFNPLQVALDAGLPPEKIRLLIVGRSPMNTWASWYGWWGKVTTVERLILAYQTAEAIRLQAEELGIDTTAFVYESIRDNGAEKSIEGLFGRLGIPFGEHTVQGWLDQPEFGSPASNIVMPAEPEAFDVPHLHDKVESADALGYFERSRDMLSLRREDVVKILNSDISQFYENWRAICAEELDLVIQPEREIV